MGILHIPDLELPIVLESKERKKDNQYGCMSRKENCKKKKIYEKNGKVRESSKWKYKSSNLVNVHAVAAFIQSDSVLI